MNEIFRCKKNISIEFHFYRSKTSAQISLISVICVLFFLNGPLMTLMFQYRLIQMVNL